MDGRAFQRSELAESERINDLAFPVHGVSAGKGYRFTGLPAIQCTHPAARAVPAQDVLLVWPNPVAIAIDLAQPSGRVPASANRGERPGAICAAQGAKRWVN